MAQDRVVHLRGASLWGSLWDGETEGLEELLDTQRSPCWRWWSSWSGCSPGCQEKYYGWTDLKRNQIMFWSPKLKNAKENWGKGFIHLVGELHLVIALRNGAEVWGEADGDVVGVHLGHAAVLWQVRQQGEQVRNHLVNANQYWIIKTMNMMIMEVKLEMKMIASTCIHVGTTWRLKLCTWS